MSAQNLNFCQKFPQNRAFAFWTSFQARRFSDSPKYQVGGAIAPLTLYPRVRPRRYHISLSCEIL